MKHLLYIFLIAILIPELSVSQSEQKFYYDSSWNGTNEENAKFYRVFKVDYNNNPVGKVMDYYITGEIQCEIESAKYVDKYNDSKSIFVGTCIGYFKNGNKMFETLRDNKGKNIGKSVYFHSNGKVSSIHNKGSKFHTRCDEFGECQKVLSEYFYTNNNEWKIINNDKIKTEIIPQKGYKIESNREYGTKYTINAPLNLNDNFSIETTVKSESKDEASVHGLVWGFKDWDNHFYFLISSNGGFKVGSRYEGVSNIFKDWTSSQKINLGATNKLKIIRISSKLLYIINGEIVYTSDFFSFKANQIGFITSGKQQVIYENLIVKQDINNSSTISQNSNSEEWSGNGTGFFIDKKGYIGTNYHVVKDANQIEIEFIRNGVKQAYSATVVQSDKQNDISIIKINSSEFKPFYELPYNIDFELADIGSDIFTLGYPLALSVMGTDIKFTDGKISSKTGIDGDITTYQISSPIQPGNSGGPLFDYNGNIIGITSSGINRKLDLTENVNYAIKSSYLKNLVEVLDYKISLPKNKNISNLKLTDKIKKLSDYVVLIKIK